MKPSLPEVKVEASTLAGHDESEWGNLFFVSNSVAYIKTQP